MQEDVVKRKTFEDNLIEFASTASIPVVEFALRTAGSVLRTRKEAEAPAPPVKRAKRAYRKKNAPATDAAMSDAPF